MIVKVSVSLYSEKHVPAACGRWCGQNFGSPRCRRASMRAPSDHPEAPCRLGEDTRSRSQSSWRELSTSICRPSSTLYLPILIRRLDHIHAFRHASIKRKKEISAMMRVCAEGRKEASCGGQGDAPKRDHVTSMSSCGAYQVAHHRSLLDSSHDTIQRRLQVVYMHKAQRPFIVQIVSPSKPQSKANRTPSDIHHMAIMMPSFSEPLVPCADVSGSSASSSASSSSMIDASGRPASSSSASTESSKMTWN
jgi:hypothetical protein